jgi:hypothetical protein
MTCYTEEKKQQGLLQNRGQRLYFSPDSALHYQGKQGQVAILGPQTLYW